MSRRGQRACCSRSTIKCASLSTRRSLITAQSVYKLVVSSQWGDTSIADRCEAARELIEQIASALLHLKAVFSLIHCHVASTNIFIRDPFQPGARRTFVLSDLGRCRRDGVVCSEALPHQGWSTMAPGANHEAGVRSAHDVYTLGAAASEVITGKHWFEKRDGRWILAEYVATRDDSV